MSSLVTNCPSCGERKVQVTKVECFDCGTRFEGKFEIPNLLKLPPEQIQFILDFVKCSGSLKEMAKIQKVSYPTLRNTLNELISNLEQLEDKSEISKEEVLVLLEKGKLTPKQAAKKLRKL